MEPILIIIIILIFSAIGRVIREGRSAKSRKGVPNSPGRTQDRSYSDKMERTFSDAKDKYADKNNREDVFIDDRVKEFREKESGRREKAKKKTSTDQRKRKSRVVTPDELLKDRKDLKKGIILKEVLGKPKSREMMQKYSR